MGLRYPEQKSGNWFFVTLTFKDWRRFGEHPGFYERLSASLKFCSEKYDAAIAGYVLMPHHIHLVIGIDGAKLGHFMRDFKKYVAQKVTLDLGLDGAVWMTGFDRVVLKSESVMRTKLNYIHENPVRSGLVAVPCGWKWSSAGDYFEEKNGPITVYKSWR